MKTFDIEYELPNRRAMVLGPYSELPLDRKIVIRGGDGTLYSARVSCRISGGVVVDVLNVLAD